MRSLGIIAVLAVFVVLTVGGCGITSDPLPPPVTADPVETYRIAPGDILAIDGGKHPQVSKKATVDQQGFVSLLLIGKVEAAGKTKSELERDVNEEFRKQGHFADPDITITVTTLFYFIDGEVSARGRRLYVRQTTLYQAIVEAGGFTQFAKRSAVRVLRTGPDGEPKVYVINVARVMQGKDADTFVVLPEDRIIVPRGF